MTCESSCAKPAVEKGFNISGQKEALHRDSPQPRSANKLAYQNTDREATDEKFGNSCWEAGQSTGDSSEHKAGNCS